MYAGWGVDFLKVDDIARPYHSAEIEAIQKAIQKTGRSIVLSLSPGEAPLNEAAHLTKYANMWRMTDDFWDTWGQLKKMFDYCADWFPYVDEGSFPDCDMLPLGRIGIRSHGGERMTRFAPDEQRTMLTLWCIFRSPLMFGGDMTKNDDFTLSLMQNRELLSINQSSHAGRLVYRKGDEVVWAANGSDGEYYLAQFNVGDEAAAISTSLSYLCIERPAQITELWDGETFSANGVITSKVAPHGVKVYKIDIS